MDVLPGIPAAYTLGHGRRAGRACGRGGAVALVAIVIIRRERASARRSDRERAAEHEQMRARVEASNEARRAADLALASMEEGVLLFGADGATRLANPAVEGHLGVRPASADALLPLGLRHLRERAASAQAVS